MSSNSLSPSNNRAELNQNLDTGVGGRSKFDKLAEIPLSVLDHAASLAVVIPKAFFMAVKSIINIFLPF